MSEKISKKARQLIENLRYELMGMIWQFCSHKGQLSHSFMSCEESSFELLGLKNGMFEEKAEEVSKQAIIKILGE